MMNCEQVAHAASDYLEHRLGFSARFAFRFHLLMCGACRAWVEQVRHARAALRSLQPPPAEAPQVEAVLGALRRERARGDSPPNEP